MILRSRSVVNRLIVPIATPFVTWISSLYREDPHDRAVVVGAVERFWSRILRFRSESELLVLIAVAGVVEQLLTAGILWVALAGTGTTVLLLPIVAIVPLPQFASVVPIPGSLGTYDVLLSGALVLMTTAPATATAAAVLLMRTVSLPFGLTSGGMAVAFLRGWRPL